MPFIPGRSGNPSGRPKGSKNRKTKVKSEFATDLINDLIGTFKSGKHYVYKHIMDGKVIYIGKGANGRAWTNRRLIDEHTEAMINGDIDIRIIASDLSEEEAYAIESALIKINQPIFNSLHKKDTNQMRIKFIKNAI